MAINFPSTPNNNDTHTENGSTWVYNSTVGAWKSANAAALIHDPAPQLGGSLDLNENGIKEDFLSSAALAQYSLCYIDNTGKLANTSAATAATSKGLLVLTLISASAADESIPCVVLGPVTTGTWTAGDTLYISETSGAITATQPTGTGKIVRPVGYALSTTVLWFQPSQTWVEL